MDFDKLNLSNLSTIHFYFFIGITISIVAKYRSFPHYPRPIIIKESLINSIFIIKGVVSGVRVSRNLSIFSPKSVFLDQF